jgi:hypothetical protein
MFRNRCRLKIGSRLSFRRDVLCARVCACAFAVTDIPRHLLQAKKEQGEDVVAQTLNAASNQANKAKNAAWEWARSKPALAPVLDKLEVVSMSNCFEIC